VPSDNLEIPGPLGAGLTEFYCT